MKTKSRSLRGRWRPGYVPWCPVVGWPDVGCCSVYIRYAGMRGMWRRDHWWLGPGYSRIQPWHWTTTSPAQPSPARGSAPSVLIETPATSCRDSDSTMMTTLKWTPGHRALIHTVSIIYTPTPPCKMCLVAVPGGSMRCAIFSSLSDCRDTGYWRTSDAKI